ncbi:MAG: hypothetical protein LBE55_07245 [Clostridiales bacterium]|jgi:hypothetical protein|nr:hypothetical protein [Clostridiales bacterium]
MKRKLALLFIILPAALFMLASCGDERLSKDDALYDFDYMVQLMLDTFPYFGLAERSTGNFPFEFEFIEGRWVVVPIGTGSIDILALAEETRAIIENYPYSLQDVAAYFGIAPGDMPAFDEHIFWSIITHEFFAHFAMFAHSDSLGFRGFNHIGTRYAHVNISRYPLTFLNSRIAWSEESSNFYRGQQDLFNTLAEEDPALFRFIFRAEPNLGEPTFPPVVRTEILEEGRIAYLNISTFGVPELSPFRSELIDFYRQIQDYDHLIIDIRENPGGILDFARMMIMYPLWYDRDNMPDMPLYSLHVDSERGNELAQLHFTEKGHTPQFIPQSDDLLTIGQLLEAYDLPYLNHDDLHNLSHGMRFDTSLAHIDQASLGRMGLRNIEHTPFGGQIWLLTGEINVSSSAMFARQAKEMGFATLVGQPVSGAYTSTWLTFFALPNSGMVIQWDIDYLVDEHGRALNEFPTRPHHFNREGMDALQTTLALIAGL